MNRLNIKSTPGWWIDMAALQSACVSLAVHSTEHVERQASGVGTPIRDDLNSQVHFGKSST